MTGDYSYVDLHTYAIVIENVLYVHILCDRVSGSSRKSAVHMGT